MDREPHKRVFEFVRALEGAVHSFAHQFDFPVDWAPGVIAQHGSPTVVDATVSILKDGTRVRRGKVRAVLTVVTERLGEYMVEMAWEMGERHFESIFSGWTQLDGPEGGPKDAEACASRLAELTARQSPVSSFADVLLILASRPLFHFQ